MANCSFCGKKITTDESIDRGMGPECFNAYTSDSNHGGMFEPVFDYHFTNDILVLIDHDEGRSLTNGMEWAVRKMAKILGKIPATFIYRDTMGNYDGVKTDGLTVTFLPIQEQDEMVAIEFFKEKYLSQGTDDGKS